MWGNGGILDHFGIGAKFLCNASSFFRFAGEFDFFPKTEMQGLGIPGLSINISMWDFSVYGHLALSGEKRTVVFYPLVGVGRSGIKAEVELNLGVLGKQSDTVSGNEFVFSYGCGLEVNFSSNTTMSLELRQKRLNLGVDNKVNFEDWRTNFALGIAFRF